MRTLLITVALAALVLAVVLTLTGCAGASALVLEGSCSSTRTFEIIRDGDKPRQSRMRVTRVCGSPVPDDPPQYDDEALKHPAEPAPEAPAQP